MIRTILLVSFVALASSIATADVHCDDTENDNFAKQICQELDEMQQIENLQLSYFGYLARENSDSLCDAGQFFYLLRKQYNQFINYSISTCEKRHYINDSMYGDFYTESSCQGNWISSYLSNLKQQRWAGNNICELPPIEEISSDFLNDISPSFNCDVAGTRVEKTICSNYKTRLYDRYMSFLYKLSITWMIPNIKKEQLEWIRNGRCDSLSKEDDVSEGWLLNCVKASYEDRIIAMENSLFDRSAKRVSRRFSDY